MIAFRLGTASSISRGSCQCLNKGSRMRSPPFGDKLPHSNYNEAVVIYADHKRAENSAPQSTKGTLNQRKWLRIGRAPAA